MSFMPEAITEASCDGSKEHMSVGAVLVLVGTSSVWDNQPIVNKDLTAYGDPRDSESRSAARSSIAVANPMSTHSRASHGLMLVIILEKDKNRHTREPQSIVSIPSILYTRKTGFIDTKHAIIR
jgi:hypothetical protein